MKFIHRFIGETEFGVGQTGADTLPPVTFNARTGAACLQEYLTPLEARELAADLIRAAEEAEAS